MTVEVDGETGEPPLPSCSSRNERGRQVAFEADARQRQERLPPVPARGEDRALDDVGVVLGAQEQEADPGVELRSDRKGDRELGRRRPALDLEHEEAWNRPDDTAPDDVLDRNPGALVLGPVPCQVRKRDPLGRQGPLVEADLPVDRRVVSYCGIVRGPVLGAGPGSGGSVECGPDVFVR